MLCYCFNCYSRPTLLLLVIFPSLGMSEKTEKVTIASSRSFWWLWRLLQRAVFSWITVWRASKEQLNVFGTKLNLKGPPLISKATNGYFGQGVWNWIKRNVPRFEKILPDANNKNFIRSFLPAGAGKFPPVTRRNRRQSLPAEIFACIRRYFCTRQFYSVISDFRASVFFYGIYYVSWIGVVLSRMVKFLGPQHDNVESL